MIVFPEDKPRKPKKEPRYFFIYGAPMSGKTFFASYFPHALDINTDNNAKQSRVPFMSLLTDENDQPITNVIQRLDDIIKGLPQTTFRTIIIDTIEDVVSAVTKQIANEAGEKYITDGKLAYGKGPSMVKTIIENLVLELKALPVNVVWISREKEQNDLAAGTSKPVPELKNTYYNIIAGNCDLVIRTQKLGPNSYYRSVEDKRSTYEPEDITDPRIRQLLESIPGMFPPKPQNETKKQEKKESK